MDGFTYWAIKLLNEKDLNLYLVVLSDDSLTGSHEVARRLRRLDLEHDLNVSLVDKL